MIGLAGHAGDGGGDARRAVLAGRLAVVRGRIEAAARATGRVPGEVTLVAVTKTHPVEDVRHLAALGVRDVGESRDQEARAKRAEFERPPPAGAEAGMARRRQPAPGGEPGGAGATGAAADAAPGGHVPAPPLRWHMVGRLQTNKARSVVRWADVVQSVDRAEAADSLARAAARAGRRPEVLVQVSLDGDPTRGGAVPDDVPALADVVASHEHLRLAGLMAVAPMGADPAAAFARLAALAERLRADHPQAQTISAGMSGDLEAAVANGATHVRVGTALLGGREAPVR